METINAPLCKGGVYGFGVCVYGFLGVMVLVYLREVGLPSLSLSLSLSLCGGGWGVGGLRVGWGWVALPSTCWREGTGADYWTPHVLMPCELKASRGSGDVIYEPLTPPQKCWKWFTQAPRRIIHWFFTNFRAQNLKKQKSTLIEACFWRNTHQLGRNSTKRIRPK